MIEHFYLCVVFMWEKCFYTVIRNLKRANWNHLPSVVLPNTSKLFRSMPPLRTEIALQPFRFAPEAAVLRMRTRLNLILWRFGYSSRNPIRTPNILSSNTKVGRIPWNVECIWVYIKHFIAYSIFWSRTWYGLLQSFLVEDNDLFIPYTLCRGCWWLGDITSHDTRNPFTNMD